ncbi:MAG TPA: hypothetical protein VIK00_01645, partial [Candidatus Limnocylindrales bacterium]
MPLGDPDPKQRLLQRRSCTSHVGRLLEALRQRALRLPSCFHGQLEIDLGSDVSRLGHDHDLVRTNLQESSGDGEVFLLAMAPDAQLTDSQRGQQRRVVRQDAQLAFDAGAYNRVDLVGKELPFWSHYLEKEGHQADRRFAFSRTSSSVPARKNACSGRSSA